MYKKIDDLSENMKRPFVLSIFGLKYKEIAKKLGLPMGTTKSRLYFARKKLQNDLERISSLEKELSQKKGCMSGCLGMAAAITGIIVLILL